MKCCSVEGCTNEYYTKGFCRKHYIRNLRHGFSETLTEMRHMNEINKKYGKLTVKQIFFKDNDYYAKCICDCGNECDTRLTLLHNNEIISCGCNRKVNINNLINISHDQYEKLSKKQQKYYNDYLINGMSYQQIANKYGVTRQAIGNAIKYALNMVV